MSPYQPETNEQCVYFNATLINMLGILPSHAMKNWQGSITTLIHAYNSMVSSVTGFSPYFLMFGHTSRIPLDVHMGLMLIEWGDSSHQNYVQKLRAQLEWTYQIAFENNQKESERHRKYYDCKFRCMRLRPDDLVLVCVKAPTSDNKIADHSEATPHGVLSQLADQPVFRIQGDAEVDKVYMYYTGTCCFLFSQLLLITAI